MDLGGMEDLIPPVAQWLGLEPSSLLLFVGILVLIARVLARVIPDDQLGPLGVVRKIASLIAIEVGNRLTKQVTVNDVAKAVIVREATKIASEIPAESKAVLRDQLPEAGKE